MLLAAAMIDEPLLAPLVALGPLWREIDAMLLLLPLMVIDDDNDWGDDIREFGGDTIAIDGAPSEMMVLDGDSPLAAKTATMGCLLL